VRTELLELTDTTKPKVTVNMYSELPGSQYGLSEMWSGDAVNAQYYLGQGVSADTLRFWFPDDGKGMVDNDLMVVLNSARNPVLAHLFLDYVLEAKNSIANFSWTGYQPPQRSIDPERLVGQGYVPPNLRSAVVREEYFTSGYRLLELPPEVDTAWHQVWQEFKAGA
ncbi:MAG: spermidine/putrescine ABC transporter substrate-binding protein, partial [Actinomycetota bacterium]|nr:spermidine/putrescine ABC transporter substrate-binding protein [Actinomycetota bacterium]